MVKYTTAERIELVKIYWTTGMSLRNTAIEFQLRHPDRPIPAPSTISRLISKVGKTGSVGKQPYDHTRPVTGEEGSTLVQASVAACPRTSVRNVSAAVGISKTSVSRLLRRDKFHPYIMQLHQELKPQDNLCRDAFCEMFTDLIDADPGLVARICFSDESTFRLNGEVNTHNCRYWAKENPHELRVGHSQFQEKVNVWAGILGYNIIGPFFIDGNLNAQKYLDLLQTEVGPALEAIDLQDPILFQQDGAPAHYGLEVRHHLDDTFPGSWIGRGGPYPWPARSPDLNPLDFFLWGHLKSVVYRTQPADLEVLKQRIRTGIAAITPQQLRNVSRAFIDRLGYCRAANGFQFEHLL